MRKKGLVTVGLIRSGNRYVNGWGSQVKRKGGKVRGDLVDGMRMAGLGS